MSRGSQLFYFQTLLDYHIQLDTPNFKNIEMGYTMLTDMDYLFHCVSCELLFEDDGDDEVESWCDHCHRVYYRTCLPSFVILKCSYFSSEYRFNYFCNHYCCTLWKTRNNRTCGQICHTINVRRI